MSIIEKKAWPEYFQKVFDGKKPYDLRLADFSAKEGDTLVLKEWDPKTKQYTGREITKNVTYVLKTKDITFWTKEDIDRYGYQIIALD